MSCAWKELLSILPDRLRRDVDHLGRDKLTELRLRAGQPAELVMTDRICSVGIRLSGQELNHLIYIVTQYSPWASSTASKGYLSAPGGHRIGMCGDVIMKDGHVAGIRSVSSLCIRVARDIPGVSSAAGEVTCSTVVIGAPGWGKTTLLRDLSRTVAKDRAVCVIDDRGELFPMDIRRGQRMDVLTGAPKEEGISMALRCMGPEYIAVDEITAVEDARAVLRAHGSGVKLLATAHAGSLEDLQTRSVYRDLLEHGVFSLALVLRSDKSYTRERI